METEKEIPEAKLTKEVRCEECEWEGIWAALVKFEKSQRELCPECGAPDSIIELDAVGPDDYRKQERV